MPDGTPPPSFAPLNRGFSSTFRPGKLTLGLVLPLETYEVGAAPDMSRHVERAQLADELGFAALWLRDVPFDVPSFGDVGQVYDPFVYLGVLSAVTRNVALGVASIILPLRHPAHVAKAAASADQLSGGRLLLGVASGDRPDEYPAMGMDFHSRGARFRDSLAYLRAVASDYPRLESDQGTLTGRIDMLPKPTAGRIPVLITGGAQQSPEWIAANGDGWMTYPRDAGAQAHVVAQYRARAADAGEGDKPVMQSLYVDLVDDESAPPRPIHLGFQSGVGFLREYLEALESQGINHVALNLRFASKDPSEIMKRLAEALLPRFATH